MPELTMPRLSDTMQEGTLARWLKQAGERVEKGEIVAEIETDKATMELEVYDSGVLEKILVQEGQTVPIGQAIAIVGDGAQAAGPEAGERTQATGAAGQAQPASEGAEPSAEPEDRSGGQQRAAADQAPSPQPSPTGRGGMSDEDDIKASPMARAIARERGIDLSKIEGSGPGGRIIRADVEGASTAQGPQQSAPRPAGEGGGEGASSSESRSEGGSPPRRAAEVRPDTGTADDDVEVVPLTNMRRVVARRMIESAQSAPHFYLTSVVDAEALVQFRAELNGKLGPDEQGSKISLNDLLIKACATSLRASPDVNVSFAGDKILRHKRIHIGMAVALDAGLIVPVIRDADQKSLGQISREAKALAERARTGKLAPAEFAGSTFTISNLGMYGIDHFTAVINPPEAAILAVGATAQEPVVRDGQVAIRHIMRLTLSIDHRSLDGATAAVFLQKLKALLEDPLRIVV